MHLSRRTQGPMSGALQWHSNRHFNCSVSTLAISPSEVAGKEGSDALSPLGFSSSSHNSQVLLACTVSTQSASTHRAVPSGHCLRTCVCKSRATPSASRSCKWRACASAARGNGMPHVSSSGPRRKFSTNASGWLRGRRMIFGRLLWLAIERGKLPVRSDTQYTGPEPAGCTWAKLEIAATS